MDSQIKWNSEALLGMLRCNAEKETLDYVMNGLVEYFGDDLPNVKTVKLFLNDPEKQTTLSKQEQLIAMYKLVECAEINFRTQCDLLRYKMLKQVGVVNSVDEYLHLIGADKDESS